MVAVGKALAKYSSRKNWESGHNYLSWEYVSIQLYVNKSTTDYM